jgi:DNA-binding transcriptional LysR family regulator
MELRRLKCFIAVAQCLHFGRAAQHVNIVQSAVSQQIKLLEEELGVKLLKRSRHRVELTEAGRVLLIEARHVVQHTEEAARRTRDAGAGKVGRLRLGFVDNALWAVLPPILRTFRDRYPKVDVSLQQLDRSQQLQAIESREVDVGVLPAPAPGPDFESELLVSAPLVLSLPSGHRLARRTRVPIELLAGEPFVSFPTSMNTRLLEMTTSACAAAGFLPTVAQEAQQLCTLLTLVSCGIGFTIVPKWVAGPHPPGIVWREIETSLPRYELLLVWQSGNRDSTLLNFRGVVSQLTETMEFGFRASSVASGAAPAKLAIAK